MNELCQYCQSLRFPNELNCCHNGKVSLLTLSDYPINLKLFNFRNNTRNYNSAFEFGEGGIKSIQL